MLYLSAQFSTIQEAQETVSRNGVLLLDIHQVLFHRKGITPLIHGLLKVHNKKRTLKEGVTALFSRSTWNVLKSRYKEGNRVTESYLDAARQYPQLHRELLRYSNNIYKADKSMYNLLAELKNRGHMLYLLSNIGNATLEKLQQEHPDFFALMNDPRNTINRDSLETDSFIWKPQLQAYQEALKAIGKAEHPHHVIFIDDTKGNVVAAHQAGMNAILFKSFSQCKNDIKKLVG